MPAGPQLHRSFHQMAAQWTVQLAVQISTPVLRLLLLMALLLLTLFELLRSLLLLRASSGCGMRHTGGASAGRAACRRVTQGAT